MIKIENVDVYGFEAAIRGMRNPLNSWDKSDSQMCHGGDGFEDCTLNVTGVCPRHEDFHHDVFCVGSEDYKLMKNLVKAGSDHSKFMRMINVTLDITAPLYWWKEFDTYKVGTVRNSCSTMHKIHSKEFNLDDFSREHLCDYKETDFMRVVDDCWCGYDVLDITIRMLNFYRKLYIETNDKKYWWQMIQLLPSSYNQRATVQLNYAVLRNMYHSRRNHKLDEWHTFCEWVEGLPYSELITGGDDA